MRVQLTELNHFGALLQEAHANRKMSAKRLREKVLSGRKKQVALSKTIRQDRLADSVEKVESDMEKRRLAHIKTILARAELLTRPKQKSLSRYTGEEGMFDDLSILERAKGFMMSEASETITADERMTMIDLAEHFAEGQSLVQNQEY